MDNRKNLLKLVVLVYLLSRIAYHLLGVRFDQLPIVYYWQYIDTCLLHDHLLKSLYHLHSQPPLFNLFLGVGLKLIPNYYVFGTVCSIVYLILGLVMTIALFCLMTRLGVSGGLSAALVILFVSSPACILYENWLFYTYPVVVALCCCALFLHRYMMQGRVTDGIIFFSLLAFLVLIRSLFHLAWFLLLIFLVTWFQRRQWRKVVTAACVPFLLAVALYAKNYCLFGEFGSSSWMGMSLAKMTTFALSGERRQALIAEGNISSLADVKPFSPMSEYRRYVTLPPPTGVAVLDQETKCNGHRNLNHLAYIAISRQCLEDAKYILTHEPMVYLKHLKRPFALYFVPSSDYKFLRENREKISKLDQFWNTVFYGRWGKDCRVGWFLLAGFFVLSLYGFFAILNAWKQVPRDEPFILTLLFMGINILYITLVCNLLEVNENQRFRFNVDPYLLVLLGLFLSSLWKRFSRTRHQPV